MNKYYTCLFVLLSVFSFSQGSTPSLPNFVTYPLCFLIELSEGDNLSDNDGFSIILVGSITSPKVSLLAKDSGCVKVKWDVKKCWFFRIW